MNQIKNERDIGGFTRSSDEGKADYSLIPQEFYQILKTPITGSARWFSDDLIMQAAWEFRFACYDGNEMVRLLLVENSSTQEVATMQKKLAMLYTKGAAIHGVNNWRKGTSKEALASFKASFYRHFMDYMSKETDEDHYSACLFNLLGAIHCLTKLEE